MTPLVALVGPTASGKSALALELAESLPLEILCTDSRTVYRELSVGAAKPSAEERERVPHRLLDLLELDELLTGPEFRALAEETASQASGRGRLPLLVGGTRLFNDELLFELERQPLSEAERGTLARAPVAEIQRRFQESGTALPLNHWDCPTLIRALDGNRVSSVRGPRRPFLLLGVGREVSDLPKRARRRVRAMLRAGLEDEVRSICLAHDRPPGSLYSIGYEEWQGRWEGRLGQAEVVDLIVENTLHYAYGQEAWLSQRPVQWVTSAEEALRLIEPFLERHEITLSSD